MQFVALLPIGSADEKYRGTCHLFEHLVIKCLPSQFSLLGFTKEDYIFFYGTYSGTNKNYLKTFIQELKALSIKDELFRKEKQIILQEISDHEKDDNELFYKCVWGNTEYMESPLGNRNYLQLINRSYFEILKKEIISRGILLYDINSNMLFETGNYCSSIPKKIKEIRFHKKIVFTFQDICFQVYIFNDNHFSFELVREILSHKNPKSIIKFCGKKYLSALILEENVVIPSISEIDQYRSYYKKGLPIRTLFPPDEYSNAMKILKQKYYYGLGPEDLNDKLREVSNREIYLLLQKLKDEH